MMHRNGQLNRNKLKEGIEVMKKERNGKQRELKI